MFLPRWYYDHRFHDEISNFSIKAWVHPHVLHTMPSITNRCPMSNRPLSLRLLHLREFAGLFHIDYLNHHFLLNFRVNSVMTFDLYKKNPIHLKCENRHGFSCGWWMYHVVCETHFIAQTKRLADKLNYLLNSICVVGFRVEPTAPFHPAFIIWWQYLLTCDSRERRVSRNLTAIFIYKQ